MKAVQGVVVAALMMAALAFAAPASASNFCVPTFFEGCPDSGGNQALATVQLALNTNGSDGQADSVKIAPGTFSSATTFTVSGSDDLTVTGSGRDQTFLTSTSVVGTFVMNLFSGNTRDITMRDLAVVIPPSFPNSGNTGSALSQLDDVLERVDIISKNDDSNGLVSTTYGGVIRDVRFIAQAGGSFGYALGTTTTVNFCAPSTPARQLIIENVSIENAKSGISADCPTVPVNATNVRIKETDNAIVSGDGNHMTVRNALIESGDGPPIQAMNTQEDGDTELDLSHVTVIGAGDLAQPGVLSRVYDVGATDDVRVDVSSSVISGFAKSWSAEAPTGVSKGNTTLGVSYSNFPATGTSSGDSTVTQGLGNSNAAPQFVGPGDYRPAAGSPLIDAGEFVSGPPVLEQDLAGNDRPVDGNGDGIAAPDAGAFEFQPPVPTCETDPALCPEPPDKTKPKVSKVKFSYKAGKGGSLRLSLSEDAKVKAVFKPTPKGKRKVVTLKRNGKTGVLKFKLGKNRFKAGNYQLRIVATDAAGNKSNPVVRKVKIKQ